MITGTNTSNSFFGDIVKDVDDIDIAVGCGENQNLSMSDVIKDLRERKRNVENGGINCIPLPFKRFRNEIPGIEQEQYVVVTAGTKGGKCFGKGTRIRMADNTVKNIEDIQVGDWVMSPNDEVPKQVLTLGHGREKMYRVSSEMHDDLVVNESHIMYLYLPREKRYTTMTIKELYARQKSCSEFYFKHKFKAVTSDECEYFMSPNLPIEPYFYGLWLGDGATKDVNITSADSEIVDYIRQYAKRLGMKFSEYLTNDRCPRYGISRNSHREKGFKDLLGSVCEWQKEHINRDYLNAPIGDRYELLAGIIDTDGYLNSHKTGYRITLKSLSLIKDIQELVRGLGMATTIRTKYNSKYERDYYELRISGKNCIKIPVKLERKRCLLTVKDFNHYPFTITELEEGDYYGLTLGGNHLFLLEDYTIVHNTQFASYVYLYHVLDYAFSHPDQCSVHVIYFALEESQMRIKHRYISHLLYKLDNIRLSPTDLRSTDSEFPLSDGILNLLETPRYKERLAFFDNCVQFETEDTNPTGILRVCEEYAKSVGEYKSLKKKSRSGSGQDVDVFQSYTPYDKKHYKIVFIDHIGLVDLERGMTLKQSMDKLSEYCVKYLRNRYKYTVVAIQQQAMESEGLDAIKQKRMVPAVATLGDTKYTARDANIVIGLFDPYFFGLPSWQKYTIQDANGDGLLNYSRFAQLIRGRDGEQGGICPLFFDGAVCDFEELPLPSDPNLQTYYAKAKRLKQSRKQKKVKQTTTSLTLLTLIKNKSKWKKIKSFFR